MKLILDVDRTLVECFVENDAKITTRPFLKQFFDHIFRICETVSIWTYSTEDRYNKKCKELLESLIPRPFFFTWTRLECHVERERTNCISSYYETTVTKPLSKVYERFPCHNEWNTFIIDDTQETYRYNSDNAIPIYPYENDEVEDFELLRVMDQISLRYLDVLNGETNCFLSGLDLSILYFFITNLVLGTPEKNSKCLLIIGRTSRRMEFMKKIKNLFRTDKVGYFLESKYLLKNKTVIFGSSYLYNKIIESTSEEINTLYSNLKINIVIISISIDDDTFIDINNFYIINVQ